MSTPTFRLNTGHAIPQIGLGVYQLEGDTAVNVIKQALQSGWRCIDSAQFYRNEKQVGQAVRESGIPRNEIFITTKVYSALETPEGCRKKLEKSLNDLDCGHIDLFLIHSPLMGKEGRIASWRNLIEFVEKDERIKAAGVSNFGVTHLKELEDAGLPAPAVNQIELHPHLAQKPIVEYCRSKGILLQAYCPLMRGQANEASLGEGAAWANQSGFGWDAPAVKRAAEKHGKTVAQVLLRWSIQHGFAPQPKTSSTSRLHENLDVFNFTLDESEMEAIDALDLEGSSEWKGKRIALEWNPVLAP